jgi:hypothetical protein
MENPEKPKPWWTQNEGPRRAVAISSILALILAVFLLRSDIKNFLLIHPWWQSLIASLPGIAVPVLAYFELRHSGEANSLRTEPITCVARQMILVPKQMTFTIKSVS